MSASDYRDHVCDLCGLDEPLEISVARQYTCDQPIHVCSGCGFVYVRARRSAEEIARVWSEEIFGDVYTAVKSPAMMARQVFVAEFLASNMEITGKRICDIGAGEGFFLEYMRDHYQVEPFAVEPSPHNGTRLQQMGIPAFTGTIEQFVASEQSASLQPDVVTIMWTLENCVSCMDMLDAAAQVLPAGGHILVATGSRILVPFKKPLFAYLSHNPADSHCFRFSANALQSALGKAGFKTVTLNRYLDNDILCALAVKSPAEANSAMRDDPQEVLSFFERWHQDSMHYLKEWKK